MGGVCVHVAVKVWVVKKPKKAITHGRHAVAIEGVPCHDQSWHKMPMEENELRATNVPVLSVHRLHPPVPSFLLTTSTTPPTSLRQKCCYKMRKEQARAGSRDAW